MLRAASATTYVAAVGAAVVLATALIMRGARRPGQRTLWYLVFFAAGAVGAAVLIFFQDAIFSLLGRSDDVSGRQHIWEAVLQRAWQHPVVGWGFTTPWLPWEPEFDHWIVDHSLTVFMAHSVWIDVFFQLGFVGVAIIAVIYVGYMWRAWFFAVDRPRWDLKADRPYSALTLLPLLIGAVVLVQSVSESRPLMEWGWLLIVMLGFKIKQAPLIGVGAEEQSLAMERGEMPKRTP
jgi:O-antigen ligase